MVVNELLMQFQADILDAPVVRPKVIETTALGAAYAAGLATRYWKSTDDIVANWAVDKRWQPSMAAGRARQALCLVEQGGDAFFRLGRRIDASKDLRPLPPLCGLEHNAGGAEAPNLRKLPLEMMACRPLGAERLQDVILGHLAILAQGMRLDLFAAADAGHFAGREPCLGRLGDRNGIAVMHVPAGDDLVRRMSRKKCRRLA